MCGILRSLHPTPTPMVPFGKQKHKLGWQLEALLPRENTQGSPQSSAIYFSVWGGLGWHSPLFPFRSQVVGRK